MLKAETVLHEENARQSHQPNKGTRSEPNREPQLNPSTGDSGNTGGTYSGDSSFKPERNPTPGNDVIGKAPAQIPLDRSSLLPQIGTTSDHVAEADGARPPDDLNAGFQAGRATADSIRPLLLTTERSAPTTRHAAYLRDDPTTSFDSPSRTTEEPERRTRLERVAQHMIGPVSSHASPQGTHTNADTDAAPAFFDSDAADARSDGRHLTDTEKGITASFPEVTGDGAELRLDNVDLGAHVTSQRARSIGITPPTTAKLRAFLQWVLDHHGAAEARHATDPDGGYGRESHGFRTLALTALDVVYGRMPLWALGRYTDPRYGTTERLFTEEELERAQPHFRSEEPTYLFRPSSERPPPDLSRLDSRVTSQQAELIGMSMDTAVKLSAFIEEVDESVASATEADWVEGSDTAAALRLSLRRREAVVKVACGQTPLATLASLRHANGRGGRIFLTSEIERAKECSVIRHPMPPPTSARPTVAAPSRPRHPMAIDLALPPNHAVGARVVLAGLSRTDLNGQLATVVVVTDPTDPERAQVRLDSTGKTVRIKRTNLRAGPIERATCEGPEELSAHIDLEDAWPATLVGVPQGDREGNGPFCHAHAPLPRNRHLTEREQGTSKDHPEVKGDGASAGVSIGEFSITTAASWLCSIWQRGRARPPAEHEHSPAAAGRQIVSAGHGNVQARPLGGLGDDNTGTIDCALTAAPTGPNLDLPAQPPTVPNLEATLETYALGQDVAPTEPTPLSPRELTAVALPVRVGDLVAARQASFTRAWYRARVERVTTSQNRPTHTVQWEDGSTTAGVPLSRLRSLVPLDGSPGADTAAGLVPPTLAMESPTTNEGLHAAYPEPSDAACHGFDEASFLASLPDGELRVSGAPSVYALPPPDGGAWHPLVHELAPVVLETLTYLESLFSAKRHDTGVAPWAVHMAWHGTWNGGHWDKVVPSKRVQEEVNRRSKAMKRRVQRMRECWPDPPAYDEYRHAPDLFHAAVALLVERGHVSPALMRRDVRGTASRTAKERKSSLLDVHWLWRLKYTPLWESPDGRNTDTIEPQSGLRATKCIKLLDRLRFEGTDAFAPPGRTTYRSLASIRKAVAHEAGGETQERQESPGAGPGARRSGTDGQRLIVFMVEVAAFRVHTDDYPTESELDSITHGSEALPDGAGGLTLRQRATISLLRDGALRHVPRPQLECKPLSQLSYLNASYATISDWGLGNTSEYVSEVPTPCPRASHSVRQTMGRFEQPEGTLMKYHDDVKRALTTPDYFVSGSSGCGEGHALAEKSTWFLIRMQYEKHPLIQYGKCGTHSLCPTLVYPPNNSADYGCHHYTIGNKRTAPNTHTEMRNFLGPLAIAALIVAAFADVDLATWENMVVLSFAAGSGSVEHACAMIGVRCYSFDLRALVGTFGALHANNFLDLTGEIYGNVEAALRSDGRHMLQVAATFADLECTTEGGLQVKKHRIIVPGTQREKALDPTHGKPKPGDEGARASDLDSQVRNVLTFFTRLQAERNKAHALAARRPDSPTGTVDPPPVPTLDAEPPTTLITTFHCAVGDHIESTTDPALNRHSTSVNLSMAVAGVTGCRGHD